MVELRARLEVKIVVEQIKRNENGDVVEAVVRDESETRSNTRVICVPRDLHLMATKVRKEGEALIDEEVNLKRRDMHDVFFERANCRVKKRH